MQGKSPEPPRQAQLCSSPRGPGHPAASPSSAMQHGAALLSLGRFHTVQRSRPETDLGEVAKSKTWPSRGLLTPLFLLTPLLLVNELHSHPLTRGTGRLWGFCKGRLPSTVGSRRGRVSGLRAEGPHALHPSIWPPKEFAHHSPPPGPCTYRLAGARAGAEDGVLADDAVGLGWGQPGHHHAAGRGGHGFDASGRAWN